MQYEQYARTGNPKNNYLYNGKELQDGLKLYDYGARLCDPAIGRWGTMDPLAEVHHGYNPYNYVLNNPMLYMDPLGLDTMGVNSHDEVPDIAVEGDVLVDSEGTSSTLLRTVPITVDAPVFGPNVSSPILDGIQTGLDVVGLIPGVW